MKSLWKSKRKHRRNQRNSLAMYSGQNSVFSFRFGWKLIELTECVRLFASVCIHMRTMFASFGAIFLQMKIRQILQEKH